MATEETSTVEQIAGEATDQAKIPPKPKASPSLKPLTAVRRRDRARYRQALMAGLPAELVEHLDGSDPEGVSQESLLSTPGVIDYAVAYLANIEDALAIVAVDPAAFDQWATKCSDDDLEALHAWYSAKYPLGEA